MIGGQIPCKRNDVLTLFVPASRINFLRGSSFSSNGKTWHGGGSSGPGIAYHASQRITNFPSDFRRNDLAQHDRGKRTDGCALGCRNRFHDARHDEFAAVGNRRHRHCHLQWRDPDLVPHRNTGDGDFAPGLRRPNEPIDLAGQLNSRALAKSEAANVLVELLFAYTEREFSCSDVARFNENVAHAKVRKRAVVVQGGAAELPETILAKDLRIRPQLAFIESGGGRDNLESRARLCSMKR